MTIENKTFRRISGTMLCAVAFVMLVCSQGSLGQSRVPDEASLEKQMEQVKSLMERGGNTPAITKRYDWLVRMQSPCSPLNQMIKAFVTQDPFAPTANLCINGALAVADPDFNRPLASSTGTGVGTGVVGNCSLSGTATAANYDVYAFNLTGCAAFPTEVTATLCGPAGCQHVGNVDTMLLLYRNVAAGDPLTANGGLPGVFNPASPCTNARGASDDLGTSVGAANNPGGATCNQVVGANCVAPCTSPSNAGGLSGWRRQLGNGRFTLVIAGFGNTTVGTYNLYVDAPAAGCQVALAPTAAGGSIGGRVLTDGGRGINGAVVSLTGGDLGQPVYARSNGFGYYGFTDIPVGQNYILTVLSKRYSFENPTRVVTLSDDLTGEDFVAAP